MPLTDPLVWIDLEMTGLDRETDEILELAVAITDGDLEAIVEGPNLVIHVSESALEKMVPVVAAMHEASGLTDDVRRSRLTPSQAENEALAFVRTHIPEAGVAPLAGNSVHTDRAFLARYMPDLEGWLHYRNVDVSTLKELVQRWAPDVYERRPDKKGEHRAQVDIRESIDELRHYRKELLG